jgi:hypothetical protein
MILKSMSPAPIGEGTRFSDQIMLIIKLGNG